MQPADTHREQTPHTPPRHGIGAEDAALASAQTGRVVEWLPEADVASWDAFVARHPRGSLFQQSRWRAVLQGGFSHLSGRFAVIRPGHRRDIAGGLAVFHARSWLLGNRLISVPFASLVEPVVSSDADLSILLRFVRSHQADSGASRAEIRLRRQPSVTPGEGWGLESDFKHHSLRLEAGREALWRGFSHGPVTRQIQRSLRDNVAVRTASGPADWQGFYRLYAGTRRRLGLPAMPEALFDSLRTHLQPEDHSLILAEKDGTLLGAVLALCFNGVYLVEWIGESEAGRRAGTNQRLYWTAIQEALERGCHTFSFGRTSNTNEGLRVYKRRWGTIEEDMPSLVTSPHAAGTQARSRRPPGVRQAAQRLIKLSPKTGFSIVSRFCYRHLA